VTFAQRLLPYLSSTTTRATPKLNSFVAQLELRINDTIARSTKSLSGGAGMRLIAHLLKLGNLEAWLAAENPFTIPRTGVLAVLGDMEKLIDPRGSQDINKTLFAKTTTPCFELLFPVHRGSMGKLMDGVVYTDPYWKTIKPFRVVDMGKAPLTFTLHNGMLLFNRQGPTHVLYTLDCLALVAKFLSYAKYKGPTSDWDRLVQEFVQFEVVIPALVQDMFSLWLRNTYHQQLLPTSPLAIHTATVWDNVTQNTLGSELSPGLRDVQQLKSELDNNNLTPSGVVSSLPVAGGEMLNRFWTDQIVHTQVTTQTSGEWLDYLKNLSLCEFLLTMTAMAPEQPYALNLHQVLTRIIRQACMTKPWNDLRQTSPYKTILQNRLEGMYSYLMTV